MERHHKDDTELYSRVALHFSMHRQIAAMLRARALRLMAQLDPGSDGASLNDTAGPR